MENSNNKIIVGILIGSPITIITLGLLLNAYDVKAITTATICGFLIILVILTSGFYVLNQKIKKLEKPCNIKERNKNAKTPK